jgi:hypothetical protein
MAKIQLTIKTSYLPGWSSWEGLRELVQNGKDSETEFKAPLTVDWYNDTVRIENEGCTLPLKALLLGHTTKADDTRTIGKFGEGLKLGVLALVRAGHEVKIRTGDEVWTPSLEDSELFGEKVLTFDVQGGRKPSNRVRVEICGINKATWLSLKQRFIFLSRVKGDQVETSAGTLLLGPDYAGKIFVKGIYVGHDVNLQFGYDFTDGEIDRDRKMVDSYDKQSRTRRIWTEALLSRPDLLGQFNGMLQAQAEDTRGFDEYSATYFPRELSSQIAAEFTTMYGADAVPVANIQESSEIGHLGKRGIVVPRGLKAILSTVLGSTETVKNKLKHEVVVQHGWHDLSEAEQSTLVEAIDLVNKVEPLMLDQVDVVDFRDQSLSGLFNGGRVQIAKKQLGELEQALETLIHETSHRKGGDGSVGHTSEMARLWRGVVKVLRGVV